MCGLNSSAGRALWRSGVDITHIAEAPVTHHCTCLTVPSQIRRAGFSAPTPIQAQAWPIAMSGRDLVAIAKTGSGKTCGFLLPGMLHIQVGKALGP